jgi:hypothetical protein
MQEPITVNYVPDGDDWAITVTREHETRSAKAPGLIAARDRADQLVEQIAPNVGRRTVVHLLDGDAYAFTTNYLHARLGLTDISAAEPPTDGPVEAVPPLPTQASGETQIVAPATIPAPVENPQGTSETPEPITEVTTGTLPMQAEPADQQADPVQQV